MQSQDEVISALTTELDHMSMEKQVLGEEPHSIITLTTSYYHPLTAEEEFVAYRKQANQMLRKASRQQAEDWDPNSDD